MTCSKNGIKKEGESCSLNNNCIYPECMEDVEELNSIIEKRLKMAEKSALLRLNSFSYFNSSITYKGQWYTVQSYIDEILNPIIDGK